MASTENKPQSNRQRGRLPKLHPRTKLSEYIQQNPDTFPKRRQRSLHASADSNFANYTPRSSNLKVLKRHHPPVSQLKIDLTKVKAQHRTRSKGNIAKLDYFYIC